MTRVPVDYEVLSVTSANATALSPDKVHPAAAPAREAAFLFVETATVRWRADGADPSTSDGVRQSPLSSFWLFGTRALDTLRVIAVSGTATLRVTYFAREA